MSKKQEKSEQGLINIIFNYPYKLTLPPTSYLVNVDNKIGVVRVKHEKGALIFDRGKTTQDTQGKNKLKLIHRRMNTGEMKFVLEGGSCSYCDFDLYGKMYFPQSFTNIQVIFPINDLRANPVQPDNSKIIHDLAEKFFKRFLFVYMYVTGDFTIRYGEKFSLPKQEWIKVYKLNDKEIKNWERNENWIVDLMLKCNKFEVHPGYKKQGGFMSQNIKSLDYGNAEKKNCTQDVFKKAFFTMATNQYIQNYYEFLFSSIRKAHMDENYHLALVDLATAVEVALSDNYSFLYFALNYNADSLDDSKFDKKIDKFSRLPLKENGKKTKSRINIYDDLRTKFENKTSNSYEKLYGNSDLENWHKNVWNIRHLIVHRGKKDVTKDDFSFALKVTQAVLNKIKIEEEKFKQYLELSKNEK